MRLRADPHRSQITDHTLGTYVADRQFDKGSSPRKLDSAPSCEAEAMAKSAPCVSAPSGLRMYENASLADLALPAGIVLVAATLARMIAMRLVLEPLAVWAVGEGSNVEFTRTKFVQAAWRTILYATACTLAVKVMFLTEELPWIYDSSLFWIDWPNHELTEGMASVYALYAGFYVHQLVYLFLDVKTSDFVALLVHHIITLGLVVSSFVMKVRQHGETTRDGETTHTHTQHTQHTHTHNT